MEKRVIDINEEQFTAEVLKGSDAVLVDFYADWCGPCKGLAPKLAEIAAEGLVPIRKINVDYLPNLAQTLDVRGLPTLVLFVDRFEVGRLSGNQPKDAIVSFILENTKP